MDGNRTAPNRRSIAFLFDELARLNGAPECLVEQIRALFPRRGVALEQDALPYLEVLEETFSRAAMLEKECISAREAMARGKENSRRFADSCLELYGQLRALDDFLGGPGHLSSEEWAKRRKQSRDRAAERLKARLGPERPFFVILTPSEPE